MNRFRHQCKDPLYLSRNHTHARTHTRTHTNHKQNNGGVVECQVVVATPTCQTTRGAPAIVPVGEIMLFPPPPPSPHIHTPTPRSPQYTARLTPHTRIVAVMLLFNFLFTSSLHFDYIQIYNTSLHTYTHPLDGFISRRVESVAHPHSAVCVCKPFSETITNGSGRKFS